MSLEYSGRDVVVTGGTGFLGSAVAKRLLAAGAHVHLPTFVEPTVGQAEAQSLPVLEHDNLTLHPPVDLSDSEAVDAFYGQVPELWASIHCAGGFDMGKIEALEVASYRRLMSMNVDTCYLCCRAAVSRIRSSGSGGRLVNVAARPALEPRTGANMVAYTMSKAAVAALTQALGEELASEGIWVNAIAPSIIDTPPNRLAMPDADHSSWPSVAELAETIAFLASPTNSSTRGGVVPVYGRS